MAVGVLTPWPTTPAALTNARAALKAETGRTDATDDQVDRIAGAASAVIERYAAEAPEAIRSEAMVRLCGYLLNSAFEQAATLEKMGELTREFPSNHSAAFRHCGAQALLAPWKVRRAGTF